MGLPFLDGHVVPVISPLSAGIDDAFEARQAVFETHALPQAGNDIRRNPIFVVGAAPGIARGLPCVFLRFPWQYANRVFALDIAGWMHQAMGQIPRIGKQQKAAGVDVQPADHDPAGSRNIGQALEYTASPFRVEPRTDLSHRLVIPKHPKPPGAGGAPGYLATVHLNPVGCPDPRAQLGGRAVDADSARLDPTLQRPPRFQARFRQYLLQLFGREMLRVRRGRFPPGSGGSGIFSPGFRMGFPRGSFGCFVHLLCWIVLG